MIIGITGNNKNSIKEISSFIAKQYNFTYIDLDFIFENLAEAYDLKNKRGPQRERILLEIKYVLEKKIHEIISSQKEGQNIIIGTTLLDKITAFNKCNAIFKVNDPSPDLDSLSLYNSLTLAPNYSNEYHLEIDPSSDWQTKITEYISYNFYHSPKVSVIVPIYNTAPYLIKCINSIRNQSYHNLEILLINDGSTDESLAISELLASEDPRIKIISKPNGGLAEARNTGIEASTGDYISFVDSDDYIEKDMIETLLRNAERYQADVSSVRAYIHTRQNTIEIFSPTRKISVFNGVDEALKGYANGDISIAAWDKLYKKSALNNLRFDPNVFKEDVDFMFRLCLNGGRYVCDTKECYHYVKRKANSLTAKFNENILKLRSWSFDAYNFLITRFQDEHKKTAQKCLFNGLTHILKTYMRDLESGLVTSQEYQEEIQQVVNDIITLLFRTDNITQYDDLDNVLIVIEKLIELKIVNEEAIPKLKLPCLGILWNSLSKEQSEAATQEISKYATISGHIEVNLEDKYRDFIKDIYFYDNEFEGIPYLKGCGLIDMFPSNTITLLEMTIDISRFIKDSRKGYVFREALALKKHIRQLFKNQVKQYAYDNIFHLTINEEEYLYTLSIINHYLGEWIEGNYGRK